MGSNEGDIKVQSSEISSTDDLLFSSFHIHTSRRTLNFQNFETRGVSPRSFYVPRSRFGASLARRSQAQTGISTRQALAVVGTIFFISSLALFYVYMRFPDIEEEEKQYVKLPLDIEDAKKLGRVLDRYKDRYFFEVLSAIFITYIFLQTFAIPGSISLSILSGFLFPFPLALVLICFCSATGASLCYVLSFFLGRRVVYKYFPDRVAQWAAIVNKHRSNLLNYIIFLRITPFLPNWFINITSPVIDVPIVPFWLGTFLGVAPPSVIAIQAGQTLYNLSTSSDAWSWFSILMLAVLSVASLVPVFLKKRFRDKFE